MIQVEYPFVAQRPDTAGAYHALYTDAFIVGGAAYSASTVGIYHPTAPVAWVHLAVIMTATTAHDAVRLRVVDTAQPAPATPLVTGVLVPDVVGLPRPLGEWLNVAAWNARTTEHYYVFETRGAPVIYGAKMRVAYEVQP